MSFRPAVNQELVIDDVVYRIVEHPFAPGVPYGQEGRAAIVYQLSAGQERRALKVFKPRYQVPAMVMLADRLEKFADLPGLQVCRRSVITARRHVKLVREHPDLAYAVLMPWIEGPTWMEVLLDSSREFSAEQSHSLANALVHILAAMEERGVAHCDLSGPNLLFPALARPPARHAPSPIELVDVEQLFGPGLDRPELVPGGSSGYAHRVAPTGLWQSQADRFAGAVLISEILGWCDPEVREAAWGESFFAPAEMQESGSARYRLLSSVLRRQWGKAVANLFEAVWESDTLADCPTFGRWVVALPDEVSRSDLAAPAVTPQTTPPQGAGLELTLPAATAALSTASSAPATPLDVLLEEARRYEAQGAFQSALNSYREARSLVPAESSMSAELALIISQLERGLQAELASAAEGEAELAGLFDEGLAAYRQGEWRQARELFTELVRRRPDYQRHGQKASILLATAESRMSGRRLVERRQEAQPSQPEATTGSLESAPMPVSEQVVRTRPALKGGLGRWLVPAALVLVLFVFGGIALIAFQGQAGQTRGPEPTPTAVLAVVEEPTATVAPGATPATSPTYPPEVYLAATQTLRAGLSMEATAQAEATSRAEAGAAQVAATVEAEATTQAVLLAGATAQAQATIQAEQAATQQAQQQARDQTNAQATSQARQQADAEATTKAQQAARASQATAQVRKDATAQAQSAQGRSQATAQAQQSATARAQSAQATTQAQAQARSQQATAEAQKNAQAAANAQQTSQAQAAQATSQARQAATAQARTQMTAQAVSQQATAQAQANAQATANAQAQANAQRTAEAQANAQATANARATAATLPRSLSGHASTVNSVRASPDGQIIVSGAADGSVRLWSFSTGALVRTLTGHTGEIWNMAFSKDGRTLATSSEDKTVRLWRVSDGAHLRTFGGHADGVWGLAILPGDQNVLSISSDAALKVWRISNGEVLYSLDEVYDADYSLDGQVLALASPDGTIKLVRQSNGAPVRTLTGHTDEVWGVGFAPDGRTLASVSADDTLRMWRVSDGALLRTIDHAPHTAYYVGFTDDGNRMMTAAFDGKTDDSKVIYIWRASDGVGLFGVPDVLSAATSKDSRFLAVGELNGHISLWQLSDGTRVRGFIGHNGGVNSIEFTPDSRTIVSGGVDKLVGLWPIP